MPRSPLLFVQDLQPDEVSRLRLLSLRSREPASAPGSSLLS
jgi:hypothetical protein